MRREIPQGAEAHGFSGDFWTLSRLTIAVKRWTGVADEERRIWHLLEASRVLVSEAPEASSGA